VRRLRILLLGLVLALHALPTAAQESEASLQLSVVKDYGFSMSGRIQGKFTLKVSGPDDLTRVEFLIDDVIVATDQEPPFSYSFSTGDHGLGVHLISAMGYTASGELVQSPVHRYEFVSADEGFRVAEKILIPILGGTVALILIAAAGTMLLGRRKGRPRIGEYGAAGGAICVRCGLPYSRHFFSPNLLIGKLERCPHCGKWAIVRRATREDLERAEARMATEEARGALELESEEEKLRRQIEDSRFES
jgi:hypothetical protein